MNVSPEAPPDLAELAELAAVTRVPSFCFSTGKSASTFVARRNESCPEPVDGASHLH
jgi:hypothetical protein